MLVVTVISRPTGVASAWPKAQPVACLRVSSALAYRHCSPAVRFFAHLLRGGGSPFVWVARWVARH